MKASLRSVSYLSVFAAIVMTARAAPPPAPVGFLWVERAPTLNADNGTHAIPNPSGFTFDDTIDNPGPGATTSANFNLGKSNIALPDAVGSGTSAGDLYYEMDTNTITLDFAVGGQENGNGSPPSRDFQVNGNVSGDFGGGRFNIHTLNYSFSGTYSQAVGLAAVSGISLTDGSAISLDLLGSMEIIRTDGTNGRASGTASFDLAVEGTFTIDQSYRTFELVEDSAIPEPSSSLLILIGLVSTLRRRR